MFMCKIKMPKIALALRPLINRCYIHTYIYELTVELCPLFYITDFKKHKIVTIIYGLIIELHYTPKILWNRVTMKKLWHQDYSTKKESAYNILVFLAIYATDALYKIFFLHNKVYIW